MMSWMKVCGSPEWLWAHDRFSDTVSTVHEMQVPRAVGTTSVCHHWMVKWGGSVSSPCLTVLGGHIIPTTKYALVYSKHYTHSLDSNLELYRIECRALCFKHSVSLHKIAQAYKHVHALTNWHKQCVRVRTHTTMQLQSTASGASYKV